MAVRWAAALCRAHGWSELSVIGHKEWQPGKIDPTFSMGTFRARVAERLKHVAPWTPGDVKPKTVVQRLAELEKRVTELEGK